MTADLFANQELQPGPVRARSTTPVSVCNEVPAPVTVRFPEHVMPASVPSRHMPPCCQCGERWPPYGFREMGGPVAARRYFGACRKHRDEVQEIVRWARL